MQPAADQAWFCPRCGRFFGAQVSFCTADGARLDCIEPADLAAGGDVLTGRTIADKYILKRRLGAGGMGAVYLAVQKPMGRQVAVKVIYPHLLGEPRLVERALREAEAANQVDHPNVVTIYDSGRTPDGMVYLAMEYLRGQDMTRYLQRHGPLQPAEALRLWLPVVRAMASAHKKGVIHRDLKPDNLFIATRDGAAADDPTEIVKIVDFGIARVRGAAGATTQGVVGTLLYMSPEQMQGQETGPQSDVYALGLILVRMLTGQLPWGRSVARGGAERGASTGGRALSTDIGGLATQVTPGPAGLSLDSAGGGAQPGDSGAAGSDTDPGEAPMTALQRLVMPPLPLSTLRPELHCSAELQELLDAVLSPQPNQRPADAGELLRLVVHLPEVQAHRDEISPEPRDYAADPSVLTRAPVCPFPGLEAFCEDQTRFFRGRDEEVRQALMRLGLTYEGRRRWLQIEGASGSGKSSLARAGLLPAVRHGLVNGTRPFAGVAVFRPGREPVRQLARALAAGLPAPHGPEPEADIASLRAIEGRLMSGPGGLLELLRERLPPEQDFLILCDQMEEALVQGAGGLSLLHFDELLAQALLAEDTPLYLITTIRSDLVGRFHELPQLEAALNSAARYYLRPMDADGLREAILEPARLSGLFFEAGLPERIVADASDAEGSLPLLAHVLRALWEGRTGRLLTRHSYEALGGVAGALTRSADGLLQGLGARGAGRARRLFLRLVKIGRGVPDTRQALPRREALKLLGADPEAESLLLRLSGAKDPHLDAPPAPRLLTIAGEPEPRVDLVHESLLHRWETLREWIAEDRKMLERRDDLEATAQVWEASGLRQDGLPTGGLLAYYEGAGLEDHQRFSLQEMTSARARHFLDEARAAEGRRERERRRRVQRGVLLLCGVVVLLAGLTTFALVERQRADRQRWTAEARLQGALLGANGVIQVIDQGLRPMAGTTGVREDLLGAVAGLLDRLLDGAPDNPGVLRSRMLSRQLRADLARTHDNTDEALAEHRAAVALAERLLAQDPRGAQARLDLALSYRQLGDLTYDSGRVPETRAAFESALRLIQVLVDGAPQRADYQLALGEMQLRMGNLAAREGHLKEATEIYQRARDIVFAACEGGHHQPPYHFALASVDEHLGEALTRSGQFREAREALDFGLKLVTTLVERAPRNEEYRRLLGALHTRLGALSLEAGDLRAAQASYGDAMATYNALLLDDPRSRLYRQRLASARRAMGDIAGRMGDLVAAQKEYAACLKLRQELSQIDPHNAAYRQGIATVYSALGELSQRRGDAAGARRYFQSALELKRELVQADPRNALSRQRLAAGFEAMAAAQQQAGELSPARADLEAALRLRKELQQADAHNARYRQELGTTYSALGALYSRLGQTEAAAAAHREALGLHQALVAQFPQNVLYQQDLAAAYARLAQTELLAGDRPRAGEACAHALALRQALAQADPQNAEWQLELVWAHLELGRLLAPGLRRPHLEAARAALRQLDAAGRLVGDRRVQQARHELDALRRR